MKKNLNEIFDGVTPAELDKLSVELNAEKLPDEVTSSIKEKTYAKADIKAVAKVKRGSRVPSAVWFRVGALAACFALIIGAIALLPTLRADEPSDIITPVETSGDITEGGVVDTSAATVATTVAATKKEGLPQKIYGDVSSGGAGAPPHMFLFDQPEDFPKFVAAVSLPKAEFEEYYKTEIYTDRGLMIDSSGRAQVAHNMEIVYLPVVSDGVTPESFSAIYDLYLNTLDIIYRIDGVRYRITYEYNKDTLPDMSERQVVLSDVYLGDFLMDLYEGNDCLVGYFLDGAVRVGIVIYTTDFENVSLDSFDMVPVASIE
jgi:hypothetical protein